MATLHLVSLSPAESRALEHCLARVGEGDAIVLLENGVYAAKDRRLRAAGRITVYALRPDLEARGLSLDHGSVPPGGSEPTQPSYLSAPAIQSG